MNCIYVFYVHKEFITHSLCNFRFSLYPEYDQAMNNLANILKDSGDLVEAEGLLQRAVDIRHDFAAAWMNLGIVQAALKKNASAEESYLNAMRHRKKYPDCWYNLGNLVCFVIFCSWYNRSKLYTLRNI